MGKHGFLTPKAIANRIKAKGLQKLKFYCQMCEKQCRDENGFKCHTMSESHQRQLLLFADNSRKYLDEFSREFRDEYVNLLKRRFNGRRVNANHVYQEYICDRDHVHMNSTKWHTLTGFIQYLHRAGIATADQTEKGWFVTYIEKDPEAVARSKKKNKMAADDEERAEANLVKQMERAKAAGVDAAGPSLGTVLLREEDSEEKVVFAMPRSISTKRVEQVTIKNNALKEEYPQTERPAYKSRRGNAPPPGTSRRGPGKKRSAMEELMEENEAGKRRKRRKDCWLAEDIVVKIITKDLGKEYFKAKGVIEEVFDTYGAKVKLSKSGKKLKLDQSHLETVIPQVGRKVLVLNGAYAGTQAVLDLLNTEEFTVNLTLSSGLCKGRTIKGLPYEDVSKLHTND